MKYGQWIVENRNVEFEGAYLNYGKIKTEIRKATHSERGFVAESSNRVSLREALRNCASSSFAASTWAGSPAVLKIKNQVDVEFENVEGFVSSHAEALTIKALAAKTTLQRLRLHKGKPDGSGEADRVKLLLGNLRTNLTDFQEFLAVNRTGFRKIAKKADKWLKNSSLVQHVSLRLQSEKWAASRQIFDRLVVLVLDLSSQLKSIEEAEEGAVWVAPSNFERNTEKYWVNPENLVRLQFAIAEHLPVLIYGQDEEQAGGKAELPTLDDYIGSVYLDNDTMGIYASRIRREEGAILVRYRWYGEDSVPGGAVFVERKTHHESWVEEKSVKERVALRTEDVEKFGQQQWSREEAEQYLQAGHRASVKDKSLSLAGEKLCKAVDLCVEIQRDIQSRALRPVVRSTYRRAAFQLASNNNVRITLDSSFCVSDESGADPGEWCLSLEHTIEPHLVKQFPYAILEVKLQGAAPPWLQSILESGMATHAPKFSKFLTGAACFFPERVPVMPYWYENEDLAQFFGRGVGGEGGGEECQFRPAVLNPGLFARVSSPQLGFTQARSTEERGGLSLAGASQGGGWPEAAPRAPPGEVVIHVGRAVIDVPRSRMKTTTNLGPLPWLIGRDRPAGSKNLAQKSTPPVLSATKRVKVEPKSYYANERTLIQWLSAAILMATIGLALLGSPSAEQRASARFKAVLPIVFGGVVMCYACTVYLWRIRRMEAGAQSGYSDRYGPICVAIVLLASILLAVFIGWPGHGYQLESDLTSIAPSPAPGWCEPVELLGVNPLNFEASDVVADAARNRYIVPWGNSLGVVPSEGGEFKTLASAPGEELDFEGAILSQDGETIYAVSEATNPFIVAFSPSSLGAFQASGRWDLDGMRNESPEAIAIVDGELFVTSSHGDIFVFELPAPAASQIADGVLEPLRRTKKLNRNLLLQGVEGSGTVSAVPAADNLMKIGGLAYDAPSGELHILYDNLRLLRTWHLPSGSLRSSTPLPGAPQGWSKMWEGVAVDLKQPQDGSGDVALVLALDTPAQLWRFRLTRDPRTKALSFPPCANAVRVNPWFTPTVA